MCGINGPSRMREQKASLVLNMIQADNCKKAQPPEHLIGLKTQKTDPNEFFIEQSLMLKKIQIQGYIIYMLCLEIS